MTADDRGSIILALLGIIILTTVATAGLATVVTGQNQTRHDDTFTQSLNNAESGLDSMVAKLKAIPTATANQSLTSTGLADSGTYTVSASPVLDLDGTGNITSTTWAIKSLGTAKSPKGTVSRAVNEEVNVSHVYTVPLYGQTNLNIGDNSSVSDYTPGVTQTMTQQVSAGVLGLVTTNITNIPVAGTPGAAATDGTLTVGSAGDSATQVAENASGFDQIGLDDAGGACVPTALCNQTVVVKGATPPPTQPDCTVAGTTGASVDGLGVAIPTGPLTLGLNFTDLSLQPGTTVTNFCTSLPIIIPSLGVNIAGISLVTVPLNATCLGVLTVNCSMNDPSTLNIQSVGAAGIQIGTCILGVVGCGVTYLSGVISAPDGTCNITGTVVLFGALNCKSITGNGSITVYYDNNLNYNTTTHTDTVLDWNECEPSTSAACKP